MTSRQQHTPKSQALADLNSQESVSTGLLITTLGAVVYGEVNHTLGAVTFLHGIVYHVFVMIWFAATTYNNDASAAVRNRRVLYVGLLALFVSLAIIYIATAVKMFIDA